MNLLSMLRVFPSDTGISTIAAFVIVAVLAGCGIAAVSAWRRNRGNVYRQRGGVAPRKPLPMFGPDLMIMQRLHVGGHPIGGVLAIGIVTLAFIGIPETRLFILLAALSGCVFGFILRLRRR